jgi:hypothetical protein
MRNDAKNHTPVFLDGPAERPFDVIEHVDAVGRSQTAFLQAVGQVVALKVLGLIAAEEAAAGPVAAVARNHIQPHAAARHVRRGAAGRVDHFLAHRAVK